MSMALPGHRDQRGPKETKKRTEAETRTAGTCTGQDLNGKGARQARGQEGGRRIQPSSAGQSLVGKTGGQEAPCPQVSEDRVVIKRRGTAQESHYCSL